MAGGQWRRRRIGAERCKRWFSPACCCSVPIWRGARGSEQTTQGLPDRPQGNVGCERIGPNSASSTTVFGPPTDVILAELTLETCFPADAASAEYLRALAINRCRQVSDEITL
jgi:hypothetical protein